jgi:hypothetical protein
MPSADPKFGCQIHDNDTAALAGYKQRSISVLPRRCPSVRSSAHYRAAISTLHLSHSLAIRSPAKIRGLFGQMGSLKTRDFSVTAPEVRSINFAITRLEVGISVRLCRWSQLTQSGLNLDCERRTDKVEGNGRFRQILQGLREPSSTIECRGT